jgi:hypothetical protein
MWNETAEWKYEDTDLVFFQCALSYLITQRGGILTWLFRLRVYQDRWGKDELAAVFTAHVDRLEKGLRFWPLISGDRKSVPGKVLVRVH